MKRRGMKWVTALLTCVLALGVMAGCGTADSVVSDSAAFATNSAAGGSYESAAEEYYEYDSVGMDMGYSKEMASPEMESGSQLQESDAASQQSNRKLIRTVNMDVETKEFDAVMSTLEKRITELGGYIENMDTYNGSAYSGYRSSRSASLTARIPQDKLTVFLSEVSEISNVTRRSENVEDVTLDYVDLSSHKKTLQAEHDRLLELMEQAEYIEDIITIEQRLSQVQYQIESMESQLRTYDNKVDYGTVYLSVSEVQELTPVHEETVWERITGGFMEDLKKIGEGALEIVIWLLTHIPSLIVWALVITLFIVWIRWCQKRSRKKAEKKAQSTAQVATNQNMNGKEENTHE